jgi:hypothetical protein
MTKADKQREAKAQQLVERLEGATDKDAWVELSVYEARLLAERYRELERGLRVATDYIERNDKPKGKRTA